MMHFSDHLMNAEVDLHNPEQGTVSRGRIVTLFEGRQWTPMAGVRFYTGPEKGRFLPVPLEMLEFTES